MGEEKPYNLATLEVITPIHREAVPPSPSGKASLKPYNRLAAWEMNLLSRLRRQLPLRGEL